jgi:predicted DNA-binding transcriptional regulator AlpA
VPLAGTAGRYRSPRALATDLESEMDGLLSVEEVAAMLRRSPETLRKDLRRNPLAVPPRVTVPGTRLLRWRREDVTAWLAANVEGRHG